MKKLLLIFVFFIFTSNMVLAEMVNWLIINLKDKTIMVAPSTIKILTDKDDVELVRYMVKTTKDRNTYLCGVVSQCSKQESENLVSVVATVNQNGKNEFDKNFKMQIPQGSLKLAHDYVCNQYYSNTINYDMHKKNAEDYALNKDYKNAIKEYDIAMLNAAHLASLGYSANRQAEILLSIGDLYSKQKKYQKAKESYLEITKLTALKNLTYIETANQKINELNEKINKH